MEIHSKPLESGSKWLMPLNREMPSEDSLKQSFRPSLRTIMSSGQSVSLQKME